MRKQARPWGRGLLDACWIHVFIMLPTTLECVSTRPVDLPALLLAFMGVRQHTNICWKQQDRPISTGHYNLVPTQRYNPEQLGWAELSRSWVRVRKRSCKDGVGLPTIPKGTSKDGVGLNQPVRMVLVINNLRVMEEKWIEVGVRKNSCKGWFGP